MDSNFNTGQVPSTSLVMLGMLWFFWGKRGIIWGCHCREWGEERTDSWDEERSQKICCTRHPDIRHKYTSLKAESKRWALAQNFAAYRIVIEVPMNLQSRHEKMKSSKKKVRSLLKEQIIMHTTTVINNNRQHVLLFIIIASSLELRCLHRWRGSSRPLCALRHPRAVHPRLNDADTSEQCEYIHKAEQGCWSINEKGLRGWSKWWLVGQVEW